MWFTPTPEQRFRQAKYKDWFRCLDRDGNGWLDVNDLGAYVSGVLTAVGWDPDDDRLLALLERTSAWWTDMASNMDEDADGSVSLDEFVGFFVTAADVARDGDVPDWAWHVVDAVFQALNLDDDGFLSPEEYRCYLEAIGSDADAAAAFEKIDVDGDGRVDLRELDLLYAEWIGAGTPGVRGNFLLTGREPSL